MNRRTIGGFIRMMRRSMAVPLPAERIGYFMTARMGRGKAH